MCAKLVDLDVPLCVIIRCSQMPSTKWKSALEPFKESIVVNGGEDWYNTALTQLPVLMGQIEAVKDLWSEYNDDNEGNNNPQNSSNSDNNNIDHNNNNNSNNNNNNNNSNNNNDKNSNNNNNNSEDNNKNSSHDNKDTTESDVKSENKDT
ncbi:hypothetical protein RFI_01213 [Reticulomyxa filosa]|uniref:Uncharacterized protein n=1 Tax=Reticulomyxa filosa TaxID=46433 RepID=X6PCQ6_RETFI|nr:hypothetical protein RFI_01213 [Reticulomyxa filosa]|eukprot:ETO35849.1 hypothetical protein RFI_01213 [Reticulomyxa filosa]